MSRPAGITMVRNEDGLKHCRRCNNWLPVDNFYDGARTDCKKCMSIALREQRFGLGEGGIDRLIKQQGGLCALCRSGLGDKFHIDHDHRCCGRLTSCGRCVRGLICHPCNVGLGHFHDDPGLLRIAADYIEKHSAQIYSKA